MRRALHSKISLGPPDSPGCGALFTDWKLRPREVKKKTCPELHSREAARPCQPLEMFLFKVHSYIKKTCPMCECHLPGCTHTHRGLQTSCDITDLHSDIS